MFMFFPQLFAMLIVFGMPLLVIGIATYASHQRSLLLHEERRLMLEKGLPLPPLPVLGMWERRAPQDTRSALEACLRRGVILVFLGAGLGLASFFDLDIPPARSLSGICRWASAIVTLTGAGNLAYWALAKDRILKEQEPSQP